MLTELISFVIDNTCWLCGSLYPAYATFHALHRHDRPAQHRWLMFWLVYSPLIVLENLPCGTSWIPWYNVTKFAYLYWLLSRRFKGAEYLYHRAMAPFLTQHQQTIDESLQAVKEKASLKAEELKREGIAQLRKHSFDILVKGQQLLIGGHQPAQLMMPSSSSAPSTPIKSTSSFPIRSPTREYTISDLYRSPAKCKIELVEDETEIHPCDVSHDDLILMTADELVQSRKDSQVNPSILDVIDPSTMALIQERTTVTPTDETHTTSNVTTTRSKRRVHINKQVDDGMTNKRERVRIARDRSATGVTLRNRPPLHDRTNHHGYSASTTTLPRMRAE